MKASELIREARNVLFERGWHQGYFTPIDDDTGEPLADDGPVCIYGAIGCVLGDVENKGISTAAVDPFLFAVLDVEDDCEVTEWNDAQERTFSEVIDALDRAEKLAEQRECFSA